MWSQALNTVQDANSCSRKVIPTGIQHGTVTVVQGGTHVQVTTFRSEGDYLDGRRPSSVAFERDIVRTRSASVQLSTMPKPAY